MHRNLLYWFFDIVFLYYFVHHYAFYLTCVMMVIASITALFIYYTAFRKLKYHFKHIFFLNLWSGYSTTVKRDHAKENIMKNIFRNRKKISLKTYWETNWETNNKCSGIYCETGKKIFEKIVRNRQKKSLK